LADKYGPRWVLASLVLWWWLHGGDVFRRFRHRAAGRPVPVWRRRSGRLSRRQPRFVALAAAVGACFRARRHPCGLAAWRRDHADLRRRRHQDLWLARAFLDAGAAGPVL